MGILYVAFFTIYIFTSNVHCAALTEKTGNAATFALLKNYTTQHCPQLSNNILVNKTTDILSRCKDVQLDQPPTDINFMNIKEYFCVGIMYSYFQFCDFFNKTNVDSKYIPKKDDFEHDLDISNNISPANNCGMIKNLSFTEGIYTAEVSKWMNVLNTSLHSPTCEHLCETLAGPQTNMWCSMLFYLTSHIKELTKIATTVTPNVTKITGMSAPDLKSTEALQNSFQSSSKKTDQNPSENVLKPNPNSLEPAAEDTTPEKIKTENAQTVKNQIPKGVGIPSAVAHQISSQKSVNKTEDKIVSPTTNASITVTPSAVTSLSANQLAEQNQQQQQPETDDQQQNKKNQSPNQTQLHIPVQTAQTAQNTDEVQIGNLDPPQSDLEFANEPKIDPDQVKEKLIDDLNETYDDEEFKNDEIEDTKQMDRLPQESIIGSGVGVRPMDVEDSNFFSYFMFISVMFIAGYVVYHNKQKIMALVLEGRRDRNSRRRPNTASYRKLNSNLEEAVTSKCSGSASHVIY